MLDKIKEIIKTWNSLGINIPMARDPVSGKGSVTASLVVLSSACLIISLVTTKVSNEGAFEFFIASATLYLGRRYQSKKSTVGDSKTEEK